MPRTVLRISLYLVLFVGGFAMVGAWLRANMRERIKVEFYKTVKDEIDVIFLGSSHVFRQFDPALFDAQRQDEPSGLRSVNLASLGMGFWEEYYMLHRILKEDAPNLKWIVVEALPYVVEMQNENDFGLRRIEWHDSPTTWRLLAEIYAQDAPWQDRWALMQRHLEHWWRRSLQLARGVELVQRWGKEPLETFANFASLGANGDGYLPLEVATASEKQRGMRRNFRRNPQKLIAGAKAMQGPGPRNLPDSGMLSAIQELEALAASHEVELIWWMHPNLQRYMGWRYMKASGVIQHFIAYDDSEAHPELYRVEAHFDLYHLNRQAAERMTMTFAFDFVTLIQEEEN
ncbi:MAG: hypothetical protein QM477_09490 [Planctomycetota bacterium]